MRTLLVVSVLVVVAVGALVGVLVTRAAPTSHSGSSPPGTSGQSSLVGKPAPDFGGTSLAGQPVSLAALRGRFVLVNFFASWCGPCRTEEPELVKLGNQHNAAGDLAILGVTFNDTASRATRFLQATGAVWSAVQDSGGHIALTYGVHRPPASFLVTPDGTLVAHFADQVTVGEVDHDIAAARAQG